jgi:hypothetical protein
MEIVQMISTVGFPIVAFLLMFWQSSKTIDQNTKALQELLVYLKK